MGVVLGVCVVVGGRCGLEWWGAAVGGVCWAISASASFRWLLAFQFKGVWYGNPTLRR